MALLGTFANTLKIPELRKRILITMGLVFLTRVIAMIPIPGVSFKALQDISQHMGGAGGLLDWFDIFSGGALTKLSVGFLSIWPYISASIIIQLVTAVIPKLERLAREGDSGRAKITQITRYLTIAICVVQCVGTLRVLQLQPIFRPAFLSHGLGFMVMAVLCVVTGSMFIMWLADQITKLGIGNGTSMIIMVNITSRLPAAIYEAAQRYFGFGGDTATRQGNPIELVLLLLLGFFVLMGTIMLVQGVRRVPIHSTRRMSGGRTFGGNATYMPLRVNFTGVMPVIFANPIMQFIGGALKFIPAEITWLGWLRSFGESLIGRTDPVHITIYVLLILFFSFFWVATQFNAMNISDNLKRDGSYIPGIRPGRATAEYLDSVMTRVTLIGAIGLIILAVLPLILQARVNLQNMTSFLGGTSLLIIVGVALDTLRQMESHLLMRNYDGFLKHGKLRGRR